MIRRITDNSRLVNECNAYRTNPVVEPVRDHRGRFPRTAGVTWPSLFKITTLILAVLCVLTAWPVSACEIVLREKPCIITETPPSVTVLPASPPDTLPLPGEYILSEWRPVYKVDTLRQYPVVDTVGWRISIYGNTYKCGRFDCIDAPFDCKVFPTLDTTWHDKVQVWLTPEEKEDYDKWKRMRIVRKWGCIAPMDKAEVKR